jgi:hypothetical protein
MVFVTIPPGRSVPTNIADAITPRIVLSGAKKAENPRAGDIMPTLRLLGKSGGVTVALILRIHEITSDRLDRMIQTTPAGLMPVGVNDILIMTM